MGRLSFWRNLLHFLGRLYYIIPLRFRKVGRMWCGGARDTREPRVTIGRLL